MIWSVDNWLGSADAQRCFDRHFATLPKDRRDEVILLILDKAARVISAGGAPQAVVPWCRAAIRNECASILRGRRHEERPTRESKERVIKRRAPADTSTAWTEESTIERLDSDDVREELVGREMGPHQRSATLTLLTTRVDHAEPGERCPRPLGGAEPWRRFEWAAVWYAGVREAVGSGNTAAKRRQRLMDDVRAVLKSIYVSLRSGFRG